MFGISIWSPSMSWLAILVKSASCEISLPRASGSQFGYFRRTPLDRRVNDYTVKIDVHASIYYGLAWQHFRRQIPRLLLHNPILDRLCNQFSDLFTLQRNELLIG